MNTPKKPGTDLAALKARLAKKAGKPEPTAEPPAPADIPAPGEVRAPPPAPPEPAAEPPPPFGADASAPEPPSERSQPDPGVYTSPTAASGPAPIHQEVQRARPDAGDNPFGGGMTFDPSDGLIEAGEVEVRSNKGLIATAGFGGILFGVAVGWLLNTMISKKDMIEKAQAKAATMMTEVQEVSDARIEASLKFADDSELRKQLKSDPEAAAKALESLLEEHFDKRPDVEALFGWQLAGLEPKGIEKTFSLYDQAERLKSDLGFLTTYIKGRAEALKQGGPKLFAVLHDGGSAKLVAALQPLCGGGNEPKPCPAGETGSASHYRVQVAPGQEPTIVPRGTGDGEAIMLGTQGMYGYAIGEKPEQHAAMIRDLTVQRIDARLEDMNKAAEGALKALEAYNDDPNVDGSGS